MPIHTRVLSHLIDALAPEPDDPESWLTLADLILMIRWSLLRRDRCHLRVHRTATRHLCTLIVAWYRDSGAYVGTQNGIRTSMARRCVAW